MSLQFFIWDHFLIPLLYSEKKWKEDLWKWKLLVVKGILYISNLAVEALSMALSQLSLTPNEAYNDLYYSQSTWTNLQATIPWLTQSLQTINTNLASGINQGTQYLADLIGTPDPTGSGRRLRDNGILYEQDTLFSMLDDMQTSLDDMSDDINNMSCNEEKSRGKTAKKSKKAKNKPQSLFDQAKVDDEEKKGPGQNRLLRVMSEQIEAKIGHLENKVDTLENKIGKLEDKMDLILNLLGATKQKVE